MLQDTDKIILGIDPGTLNLGFGIIAVRQQKLSLIAMSVLKLNSKNDHYIRLQQIHETLTNIINQYAPQYCAIEAPFYGKNVQSMLKLGRAQGVAIAAAMQCGLQVAEYSPKKIKQSITGNGNADKSQVLRMLQILLNFNDSPEALDASDAVGAAVCHYLQTKTTNVFNSNKNSWKQYIALNPQRVQM